MSLKPDQPQTSQPLEGRSDVPSHTLQTSTDASTVERIDEVLVAYLRAEDAGQEVDRQQLLAQHPDLAAELEEFFRDLDQLKDLTVPFCSSFGEFLDTQPIDPGAVSLSPTVVFEPRGDSPANGDTKADDALLRSLPNPRLRYFGNYELLSEIARGGMGIVYKARQVRLNRIVAVKMILAGHWASDQEIKRFRTEAAAAAQLQHPNIVAIHEVGECYDHHYFSMDYVAGRSLAALLHESPLPPLQAAEYIRTIAEAIQYAHSKGILHRDLKPSNILMEGYDIQGMPSGKMASQRSSTPLSNQQPYIPKVTDFGLAKQVPAGGASSALETDGAAWTVSEAIVGTPSYMPPEQASGRRGKFGPSSDVYSLGAILYEALTGRPPFRAETPLDTLVQVLDSEPAPPRILNPLVPRDLETISLKCLCKEPRQRYASAQALADELQRYINGEPILARPIGPIARTWRWCLRNRTVASLTGVVALCLVVLMIGATIAAINLRNERNAALANLNRATRAEADATEKLWGSYLAQARATRWSGRAGRRFDSLEAVSKAAAIQASAELRDEAVACMALCDVRVARHWKVSTRPSGGVTISFDAELKRYAIYDGSGTISVCDTDTHDELIRLPGPGKTLEWVLRFSPDGRWLVAKYQDESLRLWDLERRETTLIIPNGVSHGAIDFSPNSQRIAIGESNGAVRLYDVTCGQELKRFDALPQPYAIAFHPTEDKLAISSHVNRQVVVVNVDEGTVVKSLSHPAGVRGISWRSDGSLLATACATGEVLVWEFPTGRVKSLDGHLVTATHVVFNHAGNLLASYGWDGSTRIWDPISGNLQVHIAGEYIAFSRFSPDDRRLPFKVSSDEVGLWEIAPANECKTFGKGQPFSFSPNGQILAATEEAGVRLWEVQTSRPLALIPTPQAVSAQFLDDSKLLVSAMNRLSLWSSTTDASNAMWQQLAEADSTSIPEGLKVLGPAQITPNARWIVAEQLAARSPVLIDLEQQTQHLFSGVHDSRNLFLSVSPSARWVASGTWKGTGVKVWDAATRQPIADLSVEGNSNALFSPDEKWLVTGSGNEYCFWEVGAWQPRHSVKRDRAGDIWGRMAFMADGRALAVSIAREGGLQLLDPHSGRTLTKLEAPSPQTPGCFSPDGSYLAVAAEGGVLQVWNLKLVREQLSKMDLDWRTASNP